MACQGLRLHKKPSNKKTSRKTSAASTGRMPKAARAFVDVAGAFIEHWGFKRVQGEIWGVVFLSGRPMTASEVALQLGVSKALVSLAMGELLEYRVLLLTDGDDARAQRLVPNENLGEAIATVLRFREQKLIEQARLAVEAIGKLPAGDGESVALTPPRRQKLEALIDEAQNALALLVNVLDAGGTRRASKPR